MTGGPGPRGLASVRLPRKLSWRGISFTALLAVYVVLTLGVIYRSPLLTFDGFLEGLNLRRQYPEWYDFVSYYVAFGQRGPSTLVFLPFFIWIAWRTRSPRPLVMLGTALILLNVSVGVVKIITGRLGPAATDNTHAIFDGGNIYPSGHVSNTVVLYGLMAMVALEYRRTIIAIAGWLVLSVSFGTVYLNTHWVSDVFGGWIAGLLVLIALPWAMPPAERIVDSAIARYRARRTRNSQPVPMSGTRPRSPGAAVRPRSIDSTGTLTPGAVVRGTDPRVPIP